MIMAVKEYDKDCPVTMAYRKTITLLEFHLEDLHSNTIFA